MADFDTYPWQTFFNYLPVRTQQAYGPATPPGYQKPVQPTYDPFQYTQNRQSIGQMLRGGAQTVGQGIRGFGNYLANTPLPPSIGSPMPYNAAQGQQPNMGNMIRQALGQLRAVGPLYRVPELSPDDAAPPSIASPMPCNFSRNRQRRILVRPQLRSVPAATPSRQQWVPGSS